MTDIPERTIDPQAKDNDLNFELDPCDIGGVASAFFEVTATDNCDGDITPLVQVAPPAAGAMIIPSAGGDTYLLVAGPGTYQILITNSRTYTVSSAEVEQRYIDLVASVRHPMHVLEAALAGGDIATMVLIMIQNIWSVRMQPSWAPLIAFSLFVLYLLLQPNQLLRQWRTRHKLRSPGR